MSSRCKIVTASVGKTQAVRSRSFHLGELLPKPRTDDDSMRFLQGLGDLGRRKLSLREEMEEANSLDIANEQLLYPIPPDSMGLGQQAQYYEDEMDEQKDDGKQEAKVSNCDHRSTQRRAQRQPRNRKAPTTMVLYFETASNSRLRQANQNGSEVDHSIACKDSSSDYPVTIPAPGIPSQLGEKSPMSLRLPKPPLGRLQLQLMKNPPFDVVRMGPPKVTLRKVNKLTGEFELCPVLDKRHSAPEHLHGTHD